MHPFEELNCLSLMSTKKSPVSGDLSDPAANKG